MKKQELFDKTISILVKAYQNETLEHSEACGCAVGNLVCHYNGIKLRNRSSYLGVAPIDSPYRYATAWFDVVGVDNVESKYHGDAKKQIESTGYSFSEIIKIEKAFEQYKGCHFLDDTDGYLGLMSVVDALMLIHEATTEQAETAKQLFVV